MSKLSLTIATTDYDHFRDFRTAEVRAEGIDHNWLTLGNHECFARFTASREFDLSELSFAKFAAQVTRDDADIIGLPDVPASIALASAAYDHQSAAEGTYLPLTITVIALDQYSNGVPNITIDWTRTAGAFDHASTTTGADGKSANGFVDTCGVALA